MNDVLNNAYINTANELNICVDDVKQAYMSMFKMQKEILTKFNFNEYEKNNLVFLVPSLGKFIINAKKYRTLKERRLNNDKSREQE